MTSLQRIQHELTQFIHDLKNQPQTSVHSSTICYCSQELQKPQFKAQPFFMDLSFIKPLLQNFQNDLTAYNVVQYFKKIFGKRRVERVFPDSKNDVQLKSLSGLLKEQVEKLLSGVAELHLEDYEELLDEIVVHCRQVRFLDENEVHAIRISLNGKVRIGECSFEELQMLTRILLPMNSINDIFSENVPEVFDPISYIRNGYDALKSRVVAYEKLRSYNEMLTEKVWTMHLAKVLAILEMPKGVVFLGPDRSYYTVFEVVQGQGAFKYFLKVLGNNLRENYILYRGTSMLPGASQRMESLHDDVRVKLGSGGINSTAIRTDLLLSNPNLGFTKYETEKVVGIGVSLGGAHLMRDAVRMYGRFSQITTVVSPGVDTECATQFATLCNANPGHAPFVKHFIESDDILDQFGSKLLGFNCSPENLNVTVSLFEEVTDNDDAQIDGTIEDKLRRIVDKRKIELSISGIPHNISYFNRAARAHMRNTVEVPHRVLEISNQSNNDEVQSILNHSLLAKPELEKIRKVIGSFVEWTYSRL